MAKFGVAESELLILTVDAEGADLDIVSSVAWGRVLPRVVLFERIHVVRAPSRVERLASSSRDCAAGLATSVMMYAMLACRSSPRAGSSSARPRRC